MAETALILQLRPTFRQLRAQRTYTEEGVKRILFSFARDLGCKWSDERLRKFIDFD